METKTKEDKVIFKSRRHKANLRKRRGDDNAGSDSDSTEESEEWQKLGGLKEIQKLKKRVTRGINVEDLLQPPKTDNGSKPEERKKVGGMVDMKNLANELDLGNTFSVETNRRDEDADMMKYIEEEMAKRKGQQMSGESEKQNYPKETVSDDILFKCLPEHLLKSSTKKNEEMLSNQMLNGIPEVDLGIQERIRNIEATEEAKNKMLREKSVRSSTFVPANISVNFVQHKRFNVEEEGLSLPKPKFQKREPPPPVEKEPVVVIGDEPREVQMYNRQNRKFSKDKATDDYVFEKFKKQFKKY